MYIWRRHKNYTKTKQSMTIKKFMYYVRFPYIQMRCTTCLPHYIISILKNLASFQLLHCYTFTLQIYIYIIWSPYYNIYMCVCVCEQTIVQPLHICFQAQKISRGTPNCFHSMVILPSLEYCFGHFLLKPEIQIGVSAFMLTVVGRGYICHQN